MTGEITNYNPACNVRGLVIILWNNVIVPAAHEIVVFLDQPVGRSGGGSWGGEGETDRHSSQVLEMGGFVMKIKK